MSPATRMTNDCKMSCKNRKFIPGRLRLQSICWSKEGNGYKNTVS